MEIKWTLKNQLFKIGTYALAFAMLATIPATAMARKKIRTKVVAWRLMLLQNLMR